MKNILMTYGDFKFPSNPQTIGAKYTADIKQTKLFEKGGISERIAYLPAEITGEGRFYGENAEEYCMRLSFMMKENKAYELLCPGVYPLRAYLSDFSYSLDSTHPSAFYSFKFIEASNGDKWGRQFDFAVAEDGENAFDIAERCNISVDDIMRLNDIDTPFDITAGERIRIYEDSN